MVNHLRGSGTNIDLDAPLNSDRARENNPPIQDLFEALRLNDRDSVERRVADLTAATLAATGRGLDLTDTNLSGLDLSHLDLRGAVLNRAKLHGARLCGADLAGASLVSTGIERTDFRSASLVGAYVHSVAAQASNFSDADLTNLVDATGALFHGCSMREASLDGAELTGTTFYQCDLTGGRLTSADLRGAVFNECRMERGDLSGASIGEAQFLRCGVRGATLRRTRGEDLGILHPTCADDMVLGDAHLPRLRLVGVRARDLQAGNLHAPGCDVSNSHIRGCFDDADLSWSRWRRSSVEASSFIGAAVADSTWRHVTARDADFRGCHAEGMQVSDSSFAGAQFNGFAGRYCGFRNSDLHSCDFSYAYLYRSLMIGDPPSSLRMANCRFDGANLTQAYLAGDFTGASIRNAWATYARINQCDFTDADLAGTSLFRASAVKVDFTGADLSGQRGLFFADRCIGLSQALSQVDEDGRAPNTFLMSDLESLLARDTAKST